jgi:hypothetical protein
MSDLYILDDKGEPVKVDHMNWWAEWMNANRWVVLDKVTDALDIRTWFTGLDSDNGRPLLLYETAAYYDGIKIDCRRYTTRQAAEVGHRDLVEHIRIQGKSISLPARVDHVVITGHIVIDDDMDNE